MWCLTRFYECCPTWYVSVGCQCVADEGHVGAGGGVDDGIRVWGPQWTLSSSFSSSSSSSSGFWKLLLVGVRLPSLLPVCKRRKSRKVQFSNTKQTVFWQESEELTEHLNSLFRHRCFICRRTMDAMCGPTSNDTQGVCSLPHVRSDYDTNVLAIYSKVRVYCLWGIVTTAFRPLSHPQFVRFQFFRRYASVKRCMTHKDTHMFTGSCVIQKITRHPPLSNSFWLRLLRNKRTTWEKFALWRRFKSSPRNLRKRSIYRREQRFPLLDFHRSATSFGVYVLACVVYARAEEFGWENRGAQSDLIT